MNEIDLERRLDEFKKDRERNTKNPFFFKDNSESAWTISCVELTMKHDLRGYVIDWMEDEPISEDWSESLDNPVRTMEGEESIKKSKTILNF